MSATIDETALQQALAEAFPTSDELSIVIELLFDTPLNQIVAVHDRTHAQQVADVVTFVQAQNTEKQLIFGAFQQRPHNAKLRTLVEALWFDEPAQLAVFKTRACHIHNHRTTHSSTGFLVGPSLVMTTYDAIKGVLEQEVLPDDLRCSFETPPLADWRSKEFDTPYRLARYGTWLIDYSPSLNYALVRVERGPGEARYRIGQQPYKRGWTRPKEHTFKVGDDIAIVAYAAELPVSRRKITGVDSVSGRVDYTLDSNASVANVAMSLEADTRFNAVSSGAFCCTRTPNLVALHTPTDAQPFQGVLVSALLDQPVMDEILRASVPYYWTLSKPSGTVGGLGGGLIAGAIIAFAYHLSGVEPTKVAVIFLFALFAGICFGWFGIRAIHKVREWAEARRYAEIAAKSTANRSATPATNPTLLARLRSAVRRSVVTLVHQNEESRFEIVGGVLGGCSAAAVVGVFGALLFVSNRTVEAQPVLFVVGIVLGGLAVPIAGLCYDDPTHWREALGSSAWIPIIVITVLLLLVGTAIMWNERTHALFFRALYDANALTVTVGAVVIALTIALLEGLHIGYMFREFRRRTALPDPE